MNLKVGDWTIHNHEHRGVVINKIDQIAIDGIAYVFIPKNSSSYAINTTFDHEWIAPVNPLICALFGKEFPPQA